MSIPRTRNALMNDVNENYRKLMEEELQNVRNIILKSMSHYKCDDGKHAKLLETKCTSNNGLRRRRNTYCIDILNLV
jgi:hypothetical protein